VEEEPSPKDHDSEVMPAPVFGVDDPLESKTAAAPATAGVDVKAALGACPTVTERDVETTWPAESFMVRRTV
jgi:hypothetical protein